MCNCCSLYVVQVKHCADTATGCRTDQQLRTSRASLWPHSLPGNGQKKIATRSILTSVKQVSICLSDLSSLHQILYQRKSLLYHFNAAMHMHEMPFLFCCGTLFFERCPRKALHTLPHVRKCSRFDKMLSYRRETALQGAL